MDQSRFAYLLQPIRDLTKNWDIDVASQLEEYISEVGGKGQMYMNVSLKLLAPQLGLVVKS